MTIVERIKMKCKEKGTSMNALEKELGFGNGSIRLWDKKEPGSQKVILVAERLDLSLDWLLTGKESGNLTPEEQILVDTYRQADDRGKKNIMATVENEKIQLKSSTSKLG
nr:MAG TPA: transcriptional repressor DicA [Inoviridae sp.]